jgi:3D (Asp-Asp-Asp) domain-containing protein
MFLSHSFWWKVVATFGAAVGFVFVYETSTRDSGSAAQDADISVPVKAGARLVFSATAYCKGETTASGVSVRTGIAAADPSLLPVGTVVRIDMPDTRYSGIWTIMDTGPAVQGRLVDLYLWSCHEALRFGRRPIQLTVLRLGWNPRNSEPGRVDHLFKQRELERERLPLAAKPVDPTGLLTPAVPAPGPPPPPQ